MRGSHPRKAPGLLLYDSLGCVTPVDTLLLQEVANAGELLFAYRFGQQLTVGAGAFLSGGAQRTLFGVQGRQRIVALAAQRSWTSGTGPDHR
jgi:hypothetical protein